MGRQSAAGILLEIKKYFYQFHLISLLKTKEYQNIYNLATKKGRKAKKRKTARANSSEQQGKAGGGGMCGLHNLGNTCYMNRFAVTE
jgi:uncharacterized UBP type Zn finger protein